MPASHWLTVRCAPLEWTLPFWRTTDLRDASCPSSTRSKRGCAFGIQWMISGHFLRIVPKVSCPRSSGCAASCTYNTCRCSTGTILDRAWSPRWGACGLGGSSTAETMESRCTILDLTCLAPDAVGGSEPPDLPYVSRDKRPYLRSASAQ